MLSTSDELRAAIAADDNLATVALLKARVKRGDATCHEKMLYGVSLLMPPFADYEHAAQQFSDLKSGACRFEAAVWDAYRFSVLLPDGDRSFEVILRTYPESAVSAHMLSMLATADGNDCAALSNNRKSRLLRLFPSNIIEALRRDPDLSSEVKRQLWRTACDLIVSRCAESDDAVGTVVGALQRHWDNLITGVRLSSEMWAEYDAEFGGL